MIKPFIMYKNCVDEFADGTAVGLFIGQWLLIGGQYSSDNEGLWMIGVVLFNISIGVWNG